MWASPPRRPQLEAKEDHAVCKKRLAARRIVRAPPRGGARTILRAARRFLQTAWSSFASSWGRRGGDAHIRERIHQTGIDRKALAFNHPRFRWDRHVFPDGGNDAPGEDHGGVFDGRPGNRHDLRAADGKILRFASLSKESWRAIA